MKLYSFLVGLVIIAVVLLGTLNQSRVQSGIPPQSESISTAGIKLITDSIERELSAELPVSWHARDTGTESVDPLKESDALVPNRKTQTVIVIASPTRTAGSAAPNGVANAGQPSITTGNKVTTNVLTGTVAGANPTKSSNLVVANPTTFFDSKTLFIHIPPDASKRPALRVIVALHGMGGQGEAFASSLISQADKNGWVIIAPTITYQNYLDTGLLSDDDMRYSRELLATLDELPKHLTGYHLNRRAALYGFSRGAQFAHRFALMYPDRVLSVAAMSAGAYTLPYENRLQDGKTTLLPFPFGTGDFKQRLGQDPNYAELKRVKFLIQVGASDNREGDVSRAFDAFIGRTRVDRAASFVAALKELGVTARLVVLPGTGHECNAEMQKNAATFLQESSLDARSGD